MLAGQASTELLGQSEALRARLEHVRFTEGMWDVVAELVDERTSRAATVRGSKGTQRPALTEEVSAPERTDQRADTPVTNSPAMLERPDKAFPTVD